MTHKNKINTFTPNALPDDVDVHDIDSRVAGAIFAGEYSALPTENASVVFETKIPNSNPPTLTPVKPKVWLMGNMTLEKGKAYMLK